MGVGWGTLRSARVLRAGAGGLASANFSDFEIEKSQRVAASRVRSPETDARLVRTRCHFRYGAGGEAAISVASARCFGRGQPKAKRPSNQAVPNGTSPGTLI